MSSDQTRMNVSAMMRAVESGERYTIERNGEPVAVVIPYAEFKKLLDWAAVITDWPPPANVEPRDIGAAIQAYESHEG